MSKLILFAKWITCILLVSFALFLLTWWLNTPPYIRELKLQGNIAPIGQRLSTYSKEADISDYHLVIEKLYRLEPFLPKELSLNEVGIENIVCTFKEYSSEKAMYYVYIGDFAFTLDASPEIRSYINESVYFYAKDKKEIDKSNALNRINIIIDKVLYMSNDHFTAGTLTETKDSWKYIKYGMYSGIKCDYEYISITITKRGGLLARLKQQNVEFEPVFEEPQVDAKKAINIAYKWIFSPKERLYNILKGISKDNFLIDRPSIQFHKKWRGGSQVEASEEPNQVYGQYWVVKMHKTLDEHERPSRDRHSNIVFIDCESGIVVFSLKANT